MTEPSYEVVVSYHDHDLDFVCKFANDLRAGGLDVWYADPGKHDPLTLVQEKGKAVTACKVFVLILSEMSCQDAHVNDEVALAYISNSTIFPVGLVGIKKLSEKMDSGMRLMLAKINWVFFVKEKDYDANLPTLLQQITDDLAKKRETSLSPRHTGAHSAAAPFQILNAYTHVNAANRDKRDHPDPESRAEFWTRNFGPVNEVTWISFKDRFLRDYGETIDEMYGEEKERFFVNLMYKDVFDLSKTIKKSTYEQFTSNMKSSDPDAFFLLLQEYGRGMYAMREVFDMDSSLRISAVQNLGKFSTSAVINELLRMLDDEDANIRAVSAIALARSGKYSTKAVDRLMAKLSTDEDRLVRESVCYSLAHMQAKNAVFTILSAWRNDPIATVRDAAQNALKMLNCEEAKESIYMTEVLNSEISALRKPAS